MINRKDGMIWALIASLGISGCSYLIFGKPELKMGFKKYSIVFSKYGIDKVTQEEFNRLFPIPEQCPAGVVPEGHKAYRITAPFEEDMLKNGYIGCAILLTDAQYQSINNIIKSK